MESNSAVSWWMTLATSWRMAAICWLRQVQSVCPKDAAHIRNPNLEGHRGIEI